jgi:predicted RNA binding protein YcfA (HicA-like mRNA interferase family)
MSRLSNLKPERVVKAFIRAGWELVKTKKGTSHVKLRKEGYSKIVVIPVHRGKDIKRELLKAELVKAGMTEVEFLDLYK